VFRILNERLYYADFWPSVGGGDIVAVDLKAGGILWRNPLQAIGKGARATNFNSVTINANDSTVWVSGYEDGNKYIEFKDSQTGQTVAHRIVARNEPLPALRASARPQFNGDDDMKWLWSDEAAQVLYCITNQSGNFEIWLMRERWSGELTVRVMDRERELYSWPAHGSTVFHIVGERLYYAAFSAAAGGGRIVAVDLKAGKKLWESRLQGLGRIPHSFYSNRINLYVHDQVVSIYGKESAGAYGECKDVETGHTIAHKVFELPGEPAKDRDD
jgi:outer membrane protein assembly factor BamB